MTALEDRLRATLRAEADRHPVRPDLDAVRSVDGRSPVVVDLHAAPRHTRARLAVAAAILLVVGVVVGGTLVTRDDGGEPVVAATPPASGPTGFYLPGDGWEVTDVRSWDLLLDDPEVARLVTFTAPTTGEVVPLVNVRVVLATDGEAAAASLAPDADLVNRGAGASARTYRVEILGGTNPADFVVAARGDQVLTVVSEGVAAGTALALADAWWESGGEAIPTPMGTRRELDVTALDPVASTEPFRGLGERSVGGVEVTASGPDGVEATYLLAVGPAPLRPTGWEGSAAAAAAGLTGDEAPTPLTLGAPGGQGWQGVGGAAAVLPGAAATSDDPTLLEALEPVTAERWAAALDDLEVDPSLSAPTLADVPAPNDDGATATTYADHGSTGEPANGEPSGPDGAGLQPLGELDTDTVEAVLAGEDPLGCQPSDVGSGIEWPDPLGPFPSIEEAVQGAWARILVDNPELDATGFRYGRGRDGATGVGLLMGPDGVPTGYVDLVHRGDGEWALGFRTCGG